MHTRKKMRKGKGKEPKQGEGMGVETEDINKARRSDVIKAEKEHNYIGRAACISQYY